MSMRAFIFALVIIGGPILRGEDSPSATAPRAPVTDLTSISSHYHEVAARPEYHEMEEPDISSRLKDTLSQWFLQLGKKFGEFKYSGEMPAFASLLMTLLVLFSIAGLLYVMIRLTRRRATLEISSSVSAIGPKAFRPPEFYDEEIRQAIEAGNWHRAWLASWRQFLSRLENRQLVEADRTRTNREYLAQLRAHAIPAPVLVLVGAMVDAYDRTIYGRRSVGESDWNQFNGQIKEAALLLHLNEKPELVRQPRNA